MSGYLISGTWTLVRFDDGHWVIENEAGETMVLRGIPGTERSASGLHINVAGDS